MIKNITSFLRKPENYAKQIEKIDIDFFKWLVITMIAVKIFFDIISPHDFPPEFSFEKAGIISPVFFEYLISNIIILFINFFIFSPLMLFNIIKENMFFKFIFSNIIIILLTFIPFILEKFLPSLPYLIKTIYILYLILIPLSMWILISKKNIEKYIFFIKITISVQIISLISEPFMFLSEITRNELIFTIVNIIFGIAYIAYFIKLIKVKFDISVNRIIFYALFSTAFSFAYGFLIYRSEIFNSNIIKLLLY